MSTIYTCRVHHIKYRAEEICYVRGEIRNVNEIILRTKYHFEMERKLERREKVYLETFCCLEEDNYRTRYYDTICKTKRMMFQ